MLFGIIWRVKNNERRVLFLFRCYLNDLFQIYAFHIPRQNKAFYVPWHYEKYVFLYVATHHQCTVIYNDKHMICIFMSSLLQFALWWGVFPIKDKYIVLMMCHIYEYNNLDSVPYICNEEKYVIYLRLLLDVEFNTAGLRNSVHIENIGLDYV